MILSDRTIRRLIAEGRIGVEPFTPANVQPASLDVTLGEDFLVMREWVTHERNRVLEIDTRAIPPQRELYDSFSTYPDAEACFILQPGKFALATTVERLTLPADIVARVEGKSSLGRLGLLIHATAGFVDPGWSDGEITLELANVSPLPIRLYPGMKIAQLAFAYLDVEAERPYGHSELGSRYQGQRGPVGSRYGG